MVVDLGKEQIMKQDNLRSEAVEGLKNREGLLVTERSGLVVVSVAKPREGAQLTKEMLYPMVDSQTILFLSGGKTPGELYRMWAEEQRFKPGAVAMVDERIRPTMEDTNIGMIGGTGLSDYLVTAGVSLYPIGRSQKRDLGSIASSYHHTIDNLLHDQYRDGKKIAILGIGEDGHIAGIAPNRKDFTNPIFGLSGNVLAAGFDDKNGPFGKRVTLTPRSLREMDLVVCLVFGEAKENALNMMFDTHNDPTRVPARFLLDPNIAGRVVLITDQKIK